MSTKYDISILLHIEQNKFLSPTQTSLYTRQPWLSSPTLSINHIFDKHNFYVWYRTATLCKILKFRCQTKSLQSAPFIKSFSGGEWQIIHYSNNNNNNHVATTINSPKSRTNVSSCLQNAMTNRRSINR